MKSIYYNLPNEHCIFYPANGCCANWCCANISNGHGLIVFLNGWHNHMTKPTTNLKWLSYNRPAFGYPTFKWILRRSIVQRSIKYHFGLWIVSDFGSIRYHSISIIYYFKVHKDTVKKYSSSTSNLARRLNVLGLMLGM